jgi:hypothetical protein
MSNDNHQHTPCESSHRQINVSVTVSLDHFMGLACSPPVSGLYSQRCLTSETEGTSVAVVAMVVAAEPTGGVDEQLVRQLVRQLVDRARAEGLMLTGGKAAFWSG